MRKTLPPLAFIALLGACVVCSVGTAEGQTPLRPYGLSTCTETGAPFASQPGSSLFPSQGDPCKRHMGPTGQPCIKVESSARPQTLNPNIFEHWVGVTNACGQHINVKICYRNSDHCIMVDAPPWGRQDKVLGIFPALRDFSYNYTEQF